MRKFAESPGCVIQLDLVERRFPDRFNADLGIPPPRKIKVELLGPPWLERIAQQLNVAKSTALQPGHRVDDLPLGPAGRQIAANQDDAPGSRIFARPGAAQDRSEHLYVARRAALDERPSAQRSDGKADPASAGLE